MLLNVRRPLAVVTVLVLALTLLGVPAPATADTAVRTVASAQASAHSTVAKPKSKKQKRLNKEVKSAKEAVAKYCAGLYVAPGKWIKKGSKRYGRMYVCLRQLSEDDGEFTEINMILVPTKRVAGKKHDAVIKLWLDGFGTELFRRTVTNQAYWHQYTVAAGQTGAVWGVKELKGRDAKSAKQQTGED